MQKPATIKDIALRLGLSISTVSRAMRNAPDISPETKQAVLLLSEELHYQPNRLALSLRQKQTHTIGVIAPNLDYVLSTMIRGIDEVALEAGYTVMVCQSNESFGREILNTGRLLDSLVDGFIVSVSSETKIFDHLKKIQARGLPMVVFDRVTPQLSAPSVRLDNEEGGYLATEHLLDQGYKRIAMLAGPANLGVSNTRVEGYLRSLKRRGVAIDKKLVIHCDFNQDYAYYATQELLAQRRRPDAIFTISDRMALGAMLAIKEKGLSMPQDIGLVGFNNEPVMRLLTPAISSVDMPSFELGKAAAKLFIEVMHNNEDMRMVEEVLKPRLIVRESSKRL
ncbi:MAG TPA: LacI family DNA-binding transcriptional regulator [Dinghuibacter sp.]|uniref:LacI family DNA-binding transcriptional regulator n=1 Tax=Dinghuibacter sp. TaxID=2024697 RepID=UPI002BACE835|nr:LacI family DNA-binding transcriptional regulator [Dinghuibacter sp.]HTJ13453.1 LacI family DNA-binding transcriptional regulator [Dinghuibacter sp.]